MTNGQKVATTALSHLGTQESPLGSNTDGGGWIDKIEAQWGLHAEPWCAMAVSAWYREAAVDDDGVINPGTATMCARADAKGLWHTQGPVPPGAILILCGIHTEVAIAQRADGLIDCVGGNVSDGVYKTVRQLGGGWRCIVPPAILQGQPEPITVYGFDDPHFAPERFGPWHDRAARESVIAGLPVAERNHVRRVRIPGANQFAFYVLNPNKWRFGPWQDKADRDAQMADMAAKTGRQMRPWSQQVQSVPAPSSGGGPTTGVKTT
jgi:hypothetical protein